MTLREVGLVCLAFFSVFLDLKENGYTIGIKHDFPFLNIRNSGPEGGVENLGLIVIIA